MRLVLTPVDSAFIESLVHTHRSKMGDTDGLPGAYPLEMPTACSGMEFTPKTPQPFRGESSQLAPSSLGASF